MPKMYISKQYYDYLNEKIREIAIKLVRAQLEITSLKSQIRFNQQQSNIERRNNERTTYLKNQR